MTGLATELDKAISQAVIGLQETGYSWAKIAARMGVTRQAAQERGIDRRPPGPYGAASGPGSRRTSALARWVDAATVDKL